MLSKLGAWLAIAATIIAIFAIEWIIICGILKLITLCFGLTFSWLWATGIWLVILILRTIFKKA